MTFGRAVNAIFASALVLGLKLGGAVGASEPASPQEAAAFVEMLGKKTAAILASGDAGVSETRQAALRDLIRSSFNLELTGQFVLGKFWGHATRAQRAEFQDLFTEYLLRNYARHLDAYRAETLTILASKRVGERDVLVECSIERTTDTANAVWRVRADDGHYKIIDVVIDGISLALTHRREFASVIKQRGLDGLLGTLRESVAAQAEATGSSLPRKRAHISLPASILVSPNANKIGILVNRD